jgi:hypothetical protein
MADMTYESPSITELGSVADFTRGEGFGGLDSLFPLDLRAPGGGGGSQGS